jgi:hypothetical protein
MCIKHVAIANYGNFVITSMLYCISEHTGIFVSLDFVQYSSYDKKLDTRI